jgi:HPt (histidine-containing phosphotransfer) domain-containing protein
MEKALFDTSNLYELSGNGTSFVLDVLTLFMNNVPDQMKKFEAMIGEKDDFSAEEWTAIQKKAHAIKSSVLYVRIRSLFDGFQEIEHNARGERDIKKIRDKFTFLLSEYNAALPLVLEEIEKCK